jgi:8-amino-7-oxononanoate synthase
MDGDCPNLEELVDFRWAPLSFSSWWSTCIGCFGSKGEGFVQMLGLQDRIFCPYFDFRKWFRMSWAAILGSLELRDCLVNFAQSLSIPYRTSAVPLPRFWYQHLEEEQQTIAQPKTSFISIRKEHVGTETIVCTVNQQYNRPSFRNENVTSIAQLQKKDLMWKRYFRQRFPKGRNDFVLFAQF